MDNMTPEMEPQVPQVQKASKWPMVILIAVVSLLVISNLVTVYYLFIKTDTPDVVIEPAEKNNDDVVLDDNEVDDDINLADDSVSTSPGDLVVEWRDFPRESSVYSIVSSKFLKRQEVLDLGTQVLDVGKIQTPPYDQKSLYLFAVTSEGMGSFNRYYWVIYDNQETIVLGQYSDESVDWPVLQELFVYNNDSTLAGRETPKTLPLPNSDLKLVQSEMPRTKLITEYFNLKKLYSAEGISVYQDETTGCFVVRRPDSSAQEYYVNYPFLEGNRSTLNHSILSQVLDITFTDGTKNTTEYQTSALGGCGTTGCYDYINQYETLNESELVKVGEINGYGDVYYYNETVLNEADVYASLPAKAKPKDDKYEKYPIVQQYNTYFPGYDEVAQKAKEKISFNEFAHDGYPILFWQDMFGQWMKFKDVKYQAAVECGKPVIYLYPEKDMTVDVKVAPTGGIKLSDPAYNGGWSVFASTDSELLNLNDQITYPYLFWEGYGYKYNQPAQGFVIESSEVESFLQDILPRLGLNEKETADFNEFWVPEMLKQEKLYYFITFLPQKEFDVIAPLTVSPAPDKVIRIFMDYQGLDEFRNVEPLRITTPKREGFTVVEWGGALHR